MQLKQIDWSAVEFTRRHAYAATVEWLSYSQQTARQGMRCWVIARIGDWLEVFNRVLRSGGVNFAG